MVLLGSAVSSETLSLDGIVSAAILLLDSVVWSDASLILSADMLACAIARRALAATSAVVRALFASESCDRVLRLEAVAVARFAKALAVSC